MTDRRKQFRPSISQPHLFSPPPEKAHTEKAQEEKAPPPRENREEIDESPSELQPPRSLKKSSTMASLGADFFKPPAARNTSSGSDPHLPRKNARQRSSSAVQSPVRIIPRERKKKVKNEPAGNKPPREERTRDALPGLADADLPPSLLQKYESYIAKLHSHIKENQQDLPSEFRKLHEALQSQIASKNNTGTVRLNSLTNLAQALGDTGAFWDMEQEASLLPFPASQHNYSHLRETEQWRRRQIFHGKWNEDTAQGCFEEGKLWWKSPQYLLHCRAEQVNVRITLSQRDYHSPMGIYLFPATSLYRHIDLPIDIVQCSEYQVTSRLQKVFELEGMGRNKPYVLMVCSQHAGAFKLTVESKEDVKVSNVEEWEEWQVQDRWEAHCAGGCVNNESYPDNPQYLLSTNSPNPVQCQATLHYRGAVEHPDDLGLQLLEPSGSDSDPGRLSKRDDANILEKSDFSSVTQATLFFEVQRGQPRLLIPCTFDKGVLAHFELDIFSVSPLQVSKLSKPNASDVKGEWDGMHAGGCFNYPTWIDNPQYQITLTRPCRIQLTQENTSSSIGFYLAKSEGQRLLSATWDTFALKSKFINQPSVSVQVNVTPEEAEAGGTTYTIIPCTFYPGQLGSFRLQAFQQSTPAEIKPAHDPYHETIATGKWSFDTAGGCFNSATWRNNPQFELSLPTDSPVTLLVEQMGDQQLDTIGCYVIEQSEPDCRVWQDPKDQKLIKKIPFERHATGFCTFDGRADCFYTIIPCTYRPGKCRPFRLRVFTTECDECDLNLLDNPALDAGRLCEGEWNEDSSGGSMNNTTWPNNPHYLLYTDEERAHSITLVLTQRDQDDEDGWLPIGLSVTRADVHGLPALTCPEDIVASAPYEEARDIMVTLQLPRSERPFVLTPSTFSPGQLGRFTIQVFTDPEADIMLMPWHSDISFHEGDDEADEDEDDLFAVEDSDDDTEESSSAQPSAAASPADSRRALSPFRDAPWKNRAAPSTPSRPSPLVDDESRRVMFQDAHADDESDAGDADELRNEILILKDRLEYLQEEVDQHEDQTDALHGEIAQLQGQVKQLEETLAAKESELQQLQDSHTTQQSDREKEWNSHRDEMESQLAQVKEENATLQSSLESKDEQHQQAQEQVASLEKQTDTLTQQLEEAQQSLASLTEERDQLTHSHQQHEEQRSQANSREQDLTQQIDTLTEQVASLEEQLASLQGEKDEALQQVQHYQEQEEELNTEIQHLRQQVEAKQAELSDKMGEMQNQELTASELEEKCALTARALEDMTQQADQAQERVTQLKKRVDAKNQKITELQASQRETSDRYESLRKEHDTLAHKHESLQAEASDLTSQLEQLTEDHTKGASRVSELEGLSQAAEAKMTALEEERDALLQEKEENGARMQELEEKLSALQEELSGQSHWKEQASTLEEKLQDLQETLEDSQAQVQQKDKELASLQSKLDESQAQYEEELTQLKHQLDQASSKPPATPDSEPPTPESQPREIAPPENEPHEEEGEDSHRAPPPAHKNEEEPAAPPPAAPKLPSLSEEEKKKQPSKKENSPFRGTATISRSKRKKKSILTAIRGGVNLRKVKPENAGEKMKNNWVPFNVDKIIQRRAAMEEPVESNWSDDDEEMWSDSDTDSWE